MNELFDGTSIFPSVQVITAVTAAGTKLYSVPYVPKAVRCLGYVSQSVETHTEVKKPHTTGKQLKMFAVCSNHFTT